MEHCLGYVNNNQWGYWFKRPAIFNELKDAKTIVSISDITKEFDKDYFNIESDTDLTKELYGRRDIYYGNFDRPIMVFQDNSSKYPDLYNWYEITTDSKTKINPSDLKSITKSILRSNILIPASSDTYKERANRFSGKIIEFKTFENKSFYHVAMTSGEISNDHYPFYEFLIEKSRSNKILKHQIFFVDIAGIEGVEYVNLIGFLEFSCLLSIGILVALFNGTKRK